LHYLVKKLRKSPHFDFSTTIVVTKGQICIISYIWMMKGPSIKILLGLLYQSWYSKLDILIISVQNIGIYNPKYNLKIYRPTQCCSWLFVAGRTVVYRSHYKRPQFPPKVDFGGPNYNRLQRLMLRLMLTGPAGICWLLDRPGRTPFCCVAWQLQHWAYLVLLFIFFQSVLSFYHNTLQVFTANKQSQSWIYYVKHSTV